MTLSSKMTRSLHRRTTAMQASPSLIPVIVQFNRTMNRQRLREFRKALRRHRCRHQGMLSILNGWTAHVSPACLRQICTHPHVRKVYLDRVNRARLNIATPAVGAAKAQASGWKGKGIGIAILDTGVFAHPDLMRPVKRIAAFKDFIHKRKKPYDDNGHGTHVAGDAAGSGYQLKGKYKGIAPRARIIGVKVLDKQGSGRDSDIIRGIQWCMRNRKRLNIRILNLSLGKTALDNWKDDPLCLAVEKAVKAGLVVVAAAGNEGPRAGTIDSPGISPSAITVGSVNDRRSISYNDDVIAGYSSRGPAKGGISKPDLVAPGTNIISLRVPGSLLAREIPQRRLGRWYIQLSGTSFATPITAGAIALLLQKRPLLKPAQVKSLLKKHAHTLRKPRSLQGAGVLNVRFLA